MAKSVADTVARWKAGAAGAQAAYTAGVQNTQIDVMGKAAAAGADAVRGYADAWASGRVAAGIQAAGGTAGWKAATVAKAANYGTGVNLGGDKFARSMGKLLPALDGIVAGLPARVPGNPGANLARVSGVVMALHARKGEFKG